MIMARSILALALTLLVGCSAAPRNQSAGRADNRLDAILWQATSAEYHVLTRSLYAMAQAQLEPALADPNWTALASQKDHYQRLPPAVIMDIDETVIDTGAFQSQLVRNNQRYSSRPWREWQARNQPEAVPGALEFIAAAESRGVKIFFVTNREQSTEQATRKNLAAIGIKLPSDLDTVLCRNERSDWDSDKESRRRFIAQSHRVILMFGDDLGDFISEFRAPPEQRLAAALKRGEWGSRWFMLPNPMYGSWEASLYDFRTDLSADELSKQKFDKLR